MLDEIRIRTFTFKYLIQNPIDNNLNISCLYRSLEVVSFTVIMLVASYDLLGFGILAIGIHDGLETANFCRRYTTSGLAVVITLDLIFNLTVIYFVTRKYKFELTPRADLGLCYIVFSNMLSVAAVIALYLTNATRPYCLPLAILINIQSLIYFLAVSKHHTITEGSDTFLSEEAEEIKTAVKYVFAGIYAVLMTTLLILFLWNPENINPEHYTLTGNIALTTITLIFFYWANYHIWSVIVTQIDTTNANNENNAAFISIIKESGLVLAAISSAEIMGLFLVFVSSNIGNSLLKITIFFCVMLMIHSIMFFIMAHYYLKAKQTTEENRVLEITSQRVREAEIETQRKNKIMTDIRRRLDLVAPKIIEVCIRIGELEKQQLCTTFQNLKTLFDESIQQQILQNDKDPSVEQFITALTNVEHAIEDYHSSNV